MEYVVLFLAGAAASASTLFVWYFAYVVQLRREKAEVKSQNKSLTEISGRLTQQKLELDEAVAAFETRKVQYDALFKESNTLKQDLFNLSVQLKKTGRDHAAMAQRQEEIDERARELAKRYLAENVSWIGAKLTSKTFGTSKTRLQKVVKRCRDIGFEVPEQEEETLVQDLRKQFEQAVRDEFQREEQARIRAHIREEERLAREIEKQIKDAQREQAAIEAALEKALKEAVDEHSVEVEHLKAKLREAVEKGERAMSRAQMTKSGHVYVLSNIGSFGDGVFKIGMTRRLEPTDRVKELSSASVPFPFDVHMMISCDDAPGPENALHRELHKQRMNKANFRKEFFRIDLESIRNIVEDQHGDVDYVADSAALEYRETLSILDEDYEFVEETVQHIVDEEDSSDGGE
ncbi:MAG: GIY-YIG nuclease family protein [Planctomycetes bacterium]|nr:GIY-YIG nuclease family protein [Planctomycetota bacterium]